jgi:hypothetical protein
MEAICSSETSVEYQRTARRYIPKDRTLLNHLSGNFKSTYVLVLNYLSCFLNTVSMQKIQLTAVPTNPLNIQVVAFSVKYRAEW